MAGHAEDGSNARLHVHRGHEDASFDLAQALLADAHHAREIVLIERARPAKVAQWRALLHRRNLTPIGGML